MNDRIEANQRLNQHKETGELSFVDTTAALRLTGDYEGDGSSGVGKEIPQESERFWENPSIGMVVKNLIRHSEKARVKRG
tara:strand:+ start:98 stop:337 length:240 start_codon:yes stop_codon:yes gene_type:complete